MKTIELKFDNIITSLAGNSYGKTAFDEQIGNIEYDEKYEIIFPEQIKLIATSFIQGFFSRFVDVIGLEGIDKNITIKSSIPNIKNYIMDCLY